MSRRKAPHPRAVGVLLAIGSGLFLLSFSLAAPAPAPPGGAQAELPCLETSSTLEELVTCIHRYMPRDYLTDGRDGFDVPDEVELDQWRQVVRRMLRGECRSINLRSYDWGGDFVVTPFRDAQDGRTYCVLMENRLSTFEHTEGFTYTRVTHGWGTFIYNPDASLELGFSAPHVQHEAGTVTETVTLFKQTSSRTFLINGAHRNANREPSTCQGHYLEADAAHNTAHPFHAAVEALKLYYQEQGQSFFHLQFHGMRSCCTRCNIYLSQGSARSPRRGDPIWHLRRQLIDLYGGWRVGAPGDGTCDLVGSENVQGRLLHGVPAEQVCDTPATAYSGHFIHIEQCAGYRSPVDWLPALQGLFWPTYRRVLPAVWKNCPIGGCPPPLFATIQVPRRGTCGPGGEWSTECYN